MRAAVSQLNPLVFLSFFLLSAVTLVGAIWLRHRSPQGVHGFLLAGCFLALLGAVIVTHGQVSLKDCDVQSP
jgi:uncharacterized membrane protein